MPIDSRSANMLIGSLSGDCNDSDSDDCASEVEDDSYIKQMCLVQAELLPEEDDRGDYHKMIEVQERTYQTELIELAKKMNLIICLPTGSGKTYIALKLAEYMLADAIEKNKKIMFLANNVPLVHQQAKYFSKNLVTNCLTDDKYVRAITGDLNVDIWKQEQWDEVLKSYHILVMSTQILKDALTLSYVKWSDIALLILDECHHAQKNHPMAELMKNYGEKMISGATGLPKVLGLTATIIKGQSKLDKIPQDISDIEKLLCCRAVTHKNYEEVLKYSTENHMDVQQFRNDYSKDDMCCSDVNEFVSLLERLPKNFDYATEAEKSIIETINHPSLISEEQIYDKHKGVPKTLKSFLTDLLKSYAELGPYCGKLAAILKQIHIAQWVQKLESGTLMFDDSDDESDDGEMSSTDENTLTILTLLYRAQTVLLQFIKRLEARMEEMAAAALDKESQTTFDAYIVRNCVSNKIRLLLEILHSKKSANGDGEENQLCGLIFCERRITAQVLRWYLQKVTECWPDYLGFVKPEVMVGHSTIVQDTAVALFTAKRQANIVRKFHLKELNLLVATQVVEEGLNVPACNLVIRFDSILTYPSFVQSMGRARKTGAKCYALIDSEKTQEEVTKILNFVEYNKKLSAALENNALHVDTDDEVEIGVYDVHIPPFCPSGDPNGPTITATDAISIVHRYCNGLSCDRIATLLPTSFWTEEKDAQGKSIFKAFVLLPILSPVNQIVEGKWMPDKTLAKRSAFLEVCKQLHEKEELTENLLPKPRSIAHYKCPFLEELSKKADKEKKELAKKAENEKKGGTEFQNESEEKESGHMKKIGSRKRVQQYVKKIPSTIMASHVATSIPVSVFLIKIKLMEFMGKEEIKELYDFDKNQLYYGVLTTASLDKIPSFKMQANYGSLMVSLRKCKVDGSYTPCLTEEEIGRLESFQLFLRDSMYRIRNAVLRPDKRHPFLIAPIRADDNGNNQIEWGLISKLINFDEMSLQEAPQDVQRKEMNFIPDSYENSVLVPWYKEKESELEFLCTVKVLDNTSARSEFDDKSKFSTYEEYFTTKYKLEIFHPEFPLIFVKQLGKQLNFLTNKVDPKVLRKNIQRSNLSMIPELMNMHVLPGSLFVQGRFLPSVVHRIYRLLVAREFREAVALHFQWKIADDDFLNRELEEDDISNMDTSDSDSEESVSDLTMALKSISVAGEAASRNAKSTATPKRESRKRKIVLLETLNPLEVDWSLVVSCDSEDIARKVKKGADSIYAMPEPPILKSQIEDLPELADSEYNFDKEVDFALERGPSMQSVMEAMTLSNAQDCISLEKMEVIGDSVLKLFVSLHVYNSFPFWDEGRMTLLRMKLISNQHLYQIGKEREIGAILSGSFFIPDSSWMPPGFTIPDKIQNFVKSRELDYDLFKDLDSNRDDENLENVIEGTVKRKIPPHTTYTHSNIADKSVADCVEALIGAYYTKGGLDGGFRIMEWLGLRAPLQDGSVTMYSRESTLTPSKLDSSPSRRGTQKVIPLLADLEEILSYKFKNPWLAVEALTHPSYMANRDTPCYERLEFVGDAILDFLVTNYIIHHTDITDPGQITDLRAALVNNVTFASLAVRYGFHTFLKYDSELLGKYISTFVNFQEDNNHKVSEPFKLFSDFDCPTVREIEVPKVLGDLFESIAGAVLVDSGMSIDTVWKVFYRLMKKELEMFSKKIPKSPLRELYEQFPGKVRFRKLSTNPSSNPKSKNHTTPRFQTVFLQLPGLSKPIIGIGDSVKQAKQAAAKYVVRKLRELGEARANASVEHS